MFGQSWLLRAGTKAVLGAMGADPLTQAAVSRAVGWTTAHLTFDHHSQGMAEVFDGMHDAYNVHDAIDSASYDDSYEDYSMEQRFGAEGGVGADLVLRSDTIDFLDQSQHYDTMQDYPQDQHVYVWHDSQKFDVRVSGKAEYIEGAWRWPIKSNNVALNGWVTWDQIVGRV